MVKWSKDLITSNYNNLVRPIVNVLVNFNLSNDRIIIYCLTVSFILLTDWPYMMTNRYDYEQKQTVDRFGQTHHSIHWFFESTASWIDQSRAFVTIHHNVLSVKKKNRFIDTRITVPTDLLTMLVRQTISIERTGWPKKMYKFGRLTCWPFIDYFFWHVCSSTTSFGMFIQSSGSLKLATIKSNNQSPSWPLIEMSVWSKEST